jgi:hypothetical protein
MTEVINPRWADPEHKTLIATIDGVEYSIPGEFNVTNLRDEEDNLTGETRLTSGNPEMQMVLDSGVEIAEHAEPAATQADVEAEQGRRLAEGFDFDFADSRGVHRIGTDEEDMKGWSEVTTIAQALINVGQPNQTISILTNTGPVNVTATEWQQVLLAAAAFRQPIFLGTFSLIMQDPIPEDYKTNDAYWNGSLQ